jgi:hypothetical protein
MNTMTNKNQRRMATILELNSLTYMRNSSPKGTLNTKRSKKRRRLHLRSAWMSISRRMEGTSAA